MLTRAKPFLEWDVTPLDALTGSSAFFKSQLLTYPVSTFFLITAITYCRKASLPEPMRAKNTWKEKIPWVESLCGKTVYCHFQATWRQCTEPGLKHRLLTNQNFTVCITFVGFGILYQLLMAGHVSLSTQDWSLGCLFHVFPEVFL